MTNVRAEIRRDTDTGRNIVRVIYDVDRGQVYIEVTASHDDTQVASTVRMSRASFEAMVRDLGVMS